MKQLMQRFYSCLMLFRQELIVLAAGLVIFGVYYPFAVYLHRDYVRRPEPSGQVVEFIPRFEETHGGAYQALVFTNNAYAKAMLYEDSTPLQEVEIVPLPTRPPSWRFFILPRRDGSNPNTNGRRYYLVQP
jgi:hypothetical protein